MFSDLDYPDCGRCGAKKLSYYSGRCNRAGHVTEVVCGDCNDDENLTTWDANKRLTSRLTVSAAAKTYSIRATITLGRLSLPSHPWECKIAFEGSDELFPVCIYFPREYEPERIFDAGSREADRTFSVSVGSKAKREMRSGRRFRVVDRDFRAAHGVVTPWDMRWLDIAEQSDAVHALTKSPTGFEQTVWFGGLQKAVLATNDRSLGAKFTAKDGTTIEMLTYCLAGRCVIQLDAPDARLTLITAEDETEPRMGVQGIDATVDQAQGLLIAATEAWSEGRVTLATANASMWF